MSELERVIAEALDAHGSARGSQPGEFACRCGHTEHFESTNVFSRQYARRALEAHRIAAIASALRDAGLVLDRSPQGEAQR